MTSLQANIEALLLPVFSVVCALLLFGLFVAIGGHSPVEVWLLLFKGAFGDAFSIQNTLQRAAPLMMTGLCVAIPARAGSTIIGGEGALVMGALACSALPYAIDLPLNMSGTVMVLLAAALAGGLWIGLAGWMRQFRGINETISSLLLAYVAINVFLHFVEGPMRDPASLNKPSTFPLHASQLVGTMGQWDVHWGFAWGLVMCTCAGIWLGFTSNGFATRVVGGNPRAAGLVGLPTSRLVISACVLGGAAAGLAGGFEVHTTANAAVIAGLGYAGILVSFVARHQPWAVIPVAIVFGGFGAAGSMLQRRLGMPDASVQVLLGFSFVLILAMESLRGRINWQRFFESFQSPTKTQVI
jgi:ABC-type uncharacterized transport system permease subunit